MTTIAEPDGSFTLETHSIPVRAYVDGSWHEIDTTLRTSADGQIKPVATVLDETFGAGGSNLVYRVASRTSDTSVSLTWPSALPAPTLSGNDAVYQEVLPGVDLRVTADADSVREVLVVKTASAGRSPALRNLNLGLVLRGASATQQSDKRVEVRDGKGASWLTMAPPSMWDSSGAGGDRRALAADPTRRFDGPLEGDKVGNVAMSLQPTSIALVPNADLLDGASVSYPVFIDPIIHPDPNGRAMVDERFPSTPYYNWGTSSSDEGVGYQNYSDWSRKRLYWQFPTSGTDPDTLAPVTYRKTFIRSATFSAVNTYSSQCANHAVELWMTNHFNSGTTWSTKPSNIISTAIDSQSFYGGSNCGSSPRQNWTATTAVQRAADDNNTAITLSLKSPNETDPLFWKRFRADAILSVNYDTIPTISNNKLSTPAHACAPSTNPTVIGTQDVILEATTADVDADTTYVQWTLTPTGGTGTTINSAYFAPGRITSPMQTLVDGKTYSFVAKPHDNIPGTPFGDSSATCWFTIDTTTPPRPSATSTDYAQQPAPPGGGIGIGGSWTIRMSSPTDAAAVTGYKYGFDQDTPTTALAKGAGSDGAATTAVWYPRAFGPHRLRVVSVAPSGKTSEPFDYDFNVAGTFTSPLHRWTMDSLTGSAGSYSTADIGSTAVALTTPTNIPLIDGAGCQSTPCSDKALHVVSASADLTASPASGLFATSSSFVVCAKVTLPVTSRPTAGVFLIGTGKTSTAVGAAASWALGWNAASNKYYFSVRVNDDLATPLTITGDATAQTLGGFEGVCASYETQAVSEPGLSGSHRIELYYSNARRAASDISPISYDATGQVRIGSSGYAGQYWPGDIDDVRIIPGQLSASEMNQLSN